MLDVSTARGAQNPSPLLAKAYRRVPEHSRQVSNSFLVEF